MDIGDLLYDYFARLIRIMKKVVKMLFLQYGVNTDGEIIAIHAVGRGKTELRCPYWA